MNVPHGNLTEWASLNLYDAVMAIRMGRDGSADPLAPEDEATIAAALHARLDSWRPSPWTRRVEADALLRAFILAVLKECEL